VTRAGTSDVLRSRPPWLRWHPGDGVNGKQALVNETKTDGVQVRWDARLAKSVRQRVQALQNGLNDAIKRLAWTYQRFARSKQP
jgi:hypothetical protein